MNVPILHSRRFWTAVVDMIVSLALYFVSQFYPSSAEMVKFTIVAIQPVVVILIAAFTTEDVASINADAVKHTATVTADAVKYKADAQNSVPTTTSLVKQ
jgi:hypothetical protein